MMLPMPVCGRGEPFVPMPGRPKPTPPIVTVNGNGPDEHGDVKVPAVQSVNGYGPDETGALRMPKEFRGHGAPSGTGYIEGDTWFDTSSNALYHYVLSGSALAWVRQAGGDGSVSSVNGTAPDASGNVRVPATFHVASAPGEDLLPSVPAGYVEGDSLLVTTDRTRWTLCAVAGGYRWLREGYRTPETEAAVEGFAEALFGKNLGRLKDSDKTAILVALVNYVKAVEGLT